MALTFTPKAELGFSCPDFELLGVDGKTYRRDSFTQSEALVVMFICNHCPYVKAIEDRILKLARSFQGRPVSFVAICSNDPTDYPEDSYEELKARWTEKQYSFPYLHDPTQDVAKSFGAVCTPDFFVFDKNQLLTYRGRLDDSWKNPEKVRREELREAIEALLNHQLPSQTQNASMGCSIKWKE